MQDNTAPLGVSPLHDSPYGTPDGVPNNGIFTPRNDHSAQLMSQVQAEQAARAQATQAQLLAQQAAQQAAIAQAQADEQAAKAAAQAQAEAEAAQAAAQAQAAQAQAQVEAIKAAREQQAAQQAQTQQANLAIREKYRDFIYDSCHVERRADGIHATFVYKIGEHSFEPSVFIPISDIRNDEIDDDYLDVLFFNFGMINAINYYKLTLSPRFICKAGNLEDDQKAFFKKVFYHGLGELMYVNGLNIPQEEFVEIYADAPTSHPDYNDGSHYSGNLITVGGGKDSCVTLDALSSMHEDNLCLIFNRDIYPQNTAAIECIRAAGYPMGYIVNFNLTLDPHLFEMNELGYYNGHIPFSSCLAFATIIMAYLNKKAYVVLSNESSANEGNIPGTTINHQYSKSFEFEADFQNYVSNFLTRKIYYFSLLRPLNEFQIMQRFLRNPAYLGVFRSCNAGTRTNSWCSHCAKCLYVYIMLYPFLSQGQLDNIFDHNLLDDTSLLQTFIGLVMPDASKPFECVGTREEINFSLRLAIDRGRTEPCLIQYYAQNLYDPTQNYNVMNYFDPNHHIPESYLPLILN